MDILSIIGIIIVTAVAGFYFGKKYSFNETEKQNLEKQLKEKNEELDAFHSKVNTHFEKTAELFNHVSDSYQSLYDHMASSSNQLCADRTFRILPKAEKTQQAAIEPIKQNIPVSNSTDKKDLFDAEHLYQSHEYRNKEEDDTENVNTSDDNKVVEIASAKDIQDVHALDYAIKDKGVVNHNSLDQKGINQSN